MKRLAVLLLAILMLVSLAACKKPLDESLEKPPVSSGDATTDTTEDATTDTTEDTTTDPTEDTTEDVTPEPEPEPETPSKPSKPSTPSQPAFVLKTNYTGCFRGQDVLFTFKNSTASYTQLQTSEMSEEELEDYGLEGTLRATITMRAQFGKYTLKNNVVTLSKVEPGYYMQVTMEGTAAAAYCEMMKDMLDAAYEADEMSKEEYDMQLTLLKGEEFFQELEREDDTTIAVTLTDSGLVTAMTMEDSAGYKTVSTCEYKNGVLVKETELNLYPDEVEYSNDNMTTITYYSDGKTVKLEENYDVQEKAGGKWEQTKLNWKNEYRENGSRKLSENYWDGYKNVIEFNEDDIRISDITYNEAGDVVAYEECYPDGSTKKYVSIDEDGTRWETEYYEKGNRKSEKVEYPDGTSNVDEYDEQGNLIKSTVYDENGAIVDQYSYVYEYYPDGSTKKEAAYDKDGALMWSREYTYYASGMIKTEIHLEADGAKSESEYYENGYTKRHVYQGSDGTCYEEEYYENGNNKKFVYRDAEGYGYDELWNEDGELVKSIQYGENGVVESEREYSYEYNPDGTVKKRTVYDENGAFFESSEYTYYANGNTKTESCLNADGTRQEIEFDENGNCKKHTSYDENGDFASSDEYTYYADGMTKTEIRRNADGSREEFEYYENGMLKKIACYDAEGIPYYLEEYDEDGKLIEA